MVTIAVCNQKGGVGKTSIATNLIGGFDYHFPEKKKLAIDLDPQGHSSYILYRDPNDIDYEKTAYQLFQKKPYTNGDIIHRTRNTNIDMLPSNILLFGIQQGTNQLRNNFQRVRDYLNIMSNAYDIAVIDTPPDLGIFVVNGLIAADYVIIPTDLEQLSVRGITDLWKTIKNVKPKNKNLKILGVLPNKFNKRIKEQKQTMSELKDLLKDLLLEDLAIGTNAALSRAIAKGNTIFEYDKKARSYRQFKELAEWIAEKCDIHE